MLLTEYDEAAQLELARMDAEREGVEVGIALGIEKTQLFCIRKLMDKFNFSAEEAMDFLDIDLKDQPKFIIMLSSVGEV